MKKIEQWIRGYAILVSILLFAATAGAEGEMQEAVLTYRDAASNDLSFRVHALPTDAVVTLAVEFTPTANGVPLTAEPLSTPSTVNFDLKFDTASIGFAFTAADAAAAFPTRSASVSSDKPGGSTANVAVELNVAKPKGFPRSPPPAPPTFGRYLLTLNFAGGTNLGLSKDFILSLSGVPAGLQVLASLTSATFTNLKIHDPPASCPTQTCDSLGCGPGNPRPFDLCKLPSHPCEEFVWPFPPKLPPDCPMCGKEWLLPVPEGFERLLVIAGPLTPAQQPLGSGHAQELNVSVENGSKVGGLIETGEGRYIQAVDQRVGQIARVAFSGAGIVSQTIEAKLKTENDAGASVYRSVAIVLGLLLLVAVGVLAQRMAKGQR